MNHHAHQKIWVGRDKKVTRLETRNQGRKRKKTIVEAAFSSKILMEISDLAGSEVLEHGRLLLDGEHAQGLLDTLEAAIAVAKKQVGDVGSQGLGLE